VGGLAGSLIGSRMRPDIERREAAESAATAD
jgi:hypothetical protein